MDLFEAGKQLGFTPGEPITPDTLKNKIRGKAVEFHPDKLSAKGASEAEITSAKETFQKIKETAETLGVVLQYGSRKNYTMPGSKLNTHENSEWLGDYSAAISARKAEKEKKRMENMTPEDRLERERAQQKNQENKKDYERRRSGGYHTETGGGQQHTNGAGGRTHTSGTGTGGSSDRTGGTNHQNGNNGRADDNRGKKESEEKRKKREQERMEQEFRYNQQQKEKAEEQVRRAKTWEEKRKAQENLWNAKGRQDERLFEWEYFQGSHGGRGSVSEEEARKRGGTFFNSWRESRDYFRGEAQRRREEKQRARQNSQKTWERKMEEEVGGDWEKQYRENMREGEELYKKIRKAYEYWQNNPDGEDDEDRAKKREWAQEQVKKEKEFKRRMNDAWNVEMDNEQLKQEQARQRMYAFRAFVMLIVLSTVVRKNWGTFHLGETEESLLKKEQEALKREAREKEMETLRVQEQEKKAQEQKINDQYVAALDAIRGYIVAINRVDNRVFERIQEGNPSFENPYGAFQSGGIIRFRAETGEEMDCSFALHKKTVIDEDNLITADKTHDERSFIFVINNSRTIVLHLNEKKVYFLNGPQVSLQDLKRIIKGLEKIYADATPIQN